ncbi:MAG: phospholipid carrier-dependent glycosyltransferase [Kiritimatiellae bacterium]|nr:phospholipid carrier-dependent glycosyltransferase [Kiritimatiellia bacterium]MDW8459198.1 phospholipid carrier-dependent glycosyltransferase [Verrucomicrobiota bacterium]
MKLPSPFAARAALLMLLVMPPLFAGLGSADCEYHMEVMTLASSQETWLRLQTDSESWKLPTWNGSPRVNKPPLAVWLHLLAWRDLDPSKDPVDVLVFRARLVAASLGIFALLAIWRIGTLLHSSAFGWLAAAATGTSLLFLRNLRMATYDAYLFAFSTLAILCALEAILQRRSSEKESRLVLVSGWAGFGLFTACAHLVKGPISLVMTLIPAAVLIGLLRPERRQWLGLAAALILAGLLTAPWYVFAISSVPEAARIMGGEYRAARTEFQPPWYYLGLIGLVAPWSIWLVAAWVEIFRKRISIQAHAVKVPAAWFAAIFLLMSLPAAKQQRYILPILAATGLLVAVASMQVGCSGAMPRWLRVAAPAHGWLLFAVSVALALFGLLQPALLNAGLLHRPEIAVLPAWFVIILGAVLATLARRVVSHAQKLDLEGVAIWTAIWMAVAATPLLYDYAHSHHSRYRQRGEVARVMAIVGDEPLAYAMSPNLPDAYEPPDGKMLLYSRRTIPLWEPGSDPPFGYLMAGRDEALRAELEAAGWQLIDQFHDGNMPRLLFRAGRADRNNL